MQVTCPKCNRVIDAADINIDRLLAKCRSCNSVFDISAELGAGGAPPSPAPPWQASSVPIPANPVRAEPVIHAQPERADPSGRAEPEEGALQAAVRAVLTRVVGVILFAPLAVAIAFIAPTCSRGGGSEGYGEAMDNLLTLLLVAGVPLAFVGLRFFISGRWKWWSSNQKR